MRFLKHPRHMGGRSKKVIGVAMATGLLALAFASVSSAASHKTTGEYKQFGECPLSIITITDCIFSETNGGSVTVGKKTVPLVNTVILQGGFEGGGEEVQFYGAENGDTLSKTKQPVPGGLLGIVAPKWWPQWAQDWFNEGINKGFTGVTATVELAAPAEEILLNTENLLFESGTALQLPVKVKLDNALLGSECYVGSDEEPIVIPFTTGTSGALKGSAGTLSFNPTFTIITISGGKLVNGTFAAPGADGCGGFASFLIDPLVNSILGIPAGSGKNNAILEGKLQDAAASAVSESIVP